MKPSLFWAAGCAEEGGIYTCKRRNNGSVELISFLPLDRVMYIIRRGDWIYASLRAPFACSVNSGLLALHVEEDGSLIPCGTLQDAHGDVACHLCTDPTGTMLYAANYRGGTIAALPVAEDGSLAPAALVLDHRSMGNAAHPHYVCWNAGLVAVDLGLEKVLFYEKETLAGSIPFPLGSGPRHLIMERTGRYAYCARQKDGQVSRIDLTNRTLLDSDGPKDWKAQESLAAIRLSSNEKFVYASARERNTILTFAVSDKGLRLIGETDCGGRHPRDFDLTPDGKWIYCANEASDDITCLPIDTDGLPQKAQTVMRCPGALCICF